MDNKRGLSHIEAILSFVLFIGFLTFAFLFFSPLKGGSVLLDSSIDYAFNEIEEEATIQIEEYSVVIGPLGEGEEDVDEVLDIGIPINTGIGGDDIMVRVEGPNEVVLLSTYDSISNVVYFSRESENDDFFEILFAEDLSDGGGITGDILEDEDYEISSSDGRKVYSEKKIKELVESYDNDYEGLKEEFNLPSRIDFGFSFVIGEGSIVADMPIPENLEVLSRVDRIELLTEEGELVFADLIIKIW